MNTNTPPPDNRDWIDVFRTGIACVLLAMLLGLWPDYTRLFAPDGVADHRLFALHQPPLFAFVPSIHGSVWLPIAYALLCLLLAARVYARGVSLALLLVHGYLFTDRYAAVSYGADYIASTCLVFSALLPGASGANWPRTGDYLRLLQAYVCIVYFFAGFGKLLGPTWRNGEALWKAATQPGFESFFKPNLLFLGDYPLLWVVGGWLVMIIEVAYAVFIWFKATRRYWLVATIGLHVGIALLFGLYSFAALMIVLNLAAFHYPYLIPSVRKTSSRIPWYNPFRHAHPRGETPSRSGFPDSNPTASDV